MASDKTDDRTPDEKERVARQAEALERLADDEWHARVMRDSVAAHNEWAGQAVNGLEIPRLQLMDAPGRSVVPVPVVAGQVVVHTSDPADHQEAVDALAAVGYRERSRSDAIVTFSGDPADLAKALEVMADKGIRGSANHFVALRGWTAKAGASPEHPTSRMQPHDPAKGDDESATPVAVVDTGVPEGVHSGPGGWLAHVEHGTSSVDRITMADVTVTAPPMLDPAAGHGAFALGMVRQAYPDVHLGSFRALTAVGGGSEVDVVIGETTFKMFTDAGHAFAHDTKTDGTIVKAMIRGTRMIIKGTSSFGTQTTDTYSLNGFTAAYKAINKACKVKAK